MTMLPIVAMAANTKTDTVLLVNGNAITGEIKSLDFGLLSYSTCSLGTVSIDWEDIVSITTKQTLQVEVTDGTFYFGRLDSADNRFEIKVRTLSHDVNLSTARIIKMTPIDAEESFWQRLDGSFSLGFDTEKSSQVTTLRTALALQYRRQKYLVGLNSTVNITDQPGADEIHQTRSRSIIGGNYQRFRGNRWFTDWFSSWETHDELGINSRYSAGGALGRYMIQTNRHQLSTTAGLNGIRTEFIGDDQSTRALEGRFQIRYLFRNLRPNRHITFTSNIFPLLEDLSQIRAETDLILRHEIVKDMFFDVTLSHSYSSNPPTGAEKEDYTVTTSLGYSW